MGAGAEGDAVAGEREGGVEGLARHFFPLQALCRCQHGQHLLHHLFPQPVADFFGRRLRSETLEGADHDFSLDIPHVLFLTGGESQGAGDVEFLKGHRTLTLQGNLAESR